MMEHVIESVQSDVISAEEFIQHEDDLEIDAARLENCTYSRGYIRQPLWSCLTCLKQYGREIGLCTACAVQCHQGHEFAELWDRKNFRCDCPTQKEHSCEYRTDKMESAEINPLPRNKSNVYNHNFKNCFCSCNVEYDPSIDHPDMFQCYMCDDWFHVSCIARDIPGLVEPSSVPTCSDFQNFICRECALAVRFLRSYRDIHVETWRKESEHVLPSQPCENEPVKVEEGEDSSSSESVGDSNPVPVLPSQKPYGVDLSPSPSPSMATRITRDSDDVKTEKEDDSIEICKFPNMISRSFDVDTVSPMFLKFGWRTKICCCPSCEAKWSPSRRLFLHGGESEEEDEKERNLLAEEVSAARENALKELPAKWGHDVALNISSGYRRLADEIGMFLKPFSEEGRVVTADDVHEFFRQVKRPRLEPDHHS